MQSVQKLYHSDYGVKKPTPMALGPAWTTMAGGSSRIGISDTGTLDFNSSTKARASFSASTGIGNDEGHGAISSFNCSLHQFVIELLSRRETKPEVYLS